MFDREEDAITICEMKYTENPYIINKQEAEILKRKMAVFKAKTETNKQLFLALIAANGLKKPFTKDMMDDLFRKEYDGEQPNFNSTSENSPPQGLQWLFGFLSKPVLVRTSYLIFVSRHDIP